MNLIRFIQYRKEEIERERDEIPIPNMAEFNAAHTISRREGHNCHPIGLDQGFE